MRVQFITCNIDGPKTFIEPRKAVVVNCAMPSSFTSTLFVDRIVLVISKVIREHTYHEDIQNQIPSVRWRLVTTIATRYAAPADFVTLRRKPKSLFSKTKK